jgi:peptide/nickel transport system permease protein
MGETSPKAGPFEVQRTQEIMRVYRRFVRDRLGVISLGVVVAYVLCALFAPWLAPYDPFEINPPESLEPPSKDHWLGNDELGRDLASRLIYGARISLAFGVVTTAIAAVMGIILGVVAGYYGGAVDNLIMRLVDLLLAFPEILLAIAVVSVLGPGTGNAMIAIGIHSVPMFSRTVRAQTLLIREQDYTQAARSLGSPGWRIIWRHILPNAIAPVIVLAALRIATAILAASTLSFLGLGVQKPTPEWGAILSSGRNHLRTAPHLMLYPGIALSVVVIAFSSLGDAMRDALDPKLRGV